MRKRNTPFLLPKLQRKLKQKLEVWGWLLFLHSVSCTILFKILYYGYADVEKKRVEEVAAENAKKGKEDARGENSSRVFNCNLCICRYFSCALLTVEAEKKRSEKMEAEAAKKNEEDAGGENACNCFCSFQV